MIAGNHPPEALATCLLLLLCYDAQFHIHANHTRPAEAKLDMTLHDLTHEKVHPSKAVKSVPAIAIVQTRA